MGSLKSLDAGNGYIAYGRFDENECCAVVINCTDGEISLTVPVWELGVPHDKARMSLKFACGGWGFTEDSEEIEVKHGRIFLTLPEKTGAVLYYSFKEEQ